MARYRRRALQVDAVQFLQVTKRGAPRFGGKAPEWLKEALDKPHAEPGAAYVAGSQLTIRTADGPFNANPRDWVVRGESGEIQPCAAAVFAETFEEIV